MIPGITAACKSTTEHLLVAALDFCFYWRKRSINMGHTVWRLLKVFLLFKAYIEMSVSSVKLTVAMLELITWVVLKHPNGNYYFFLLQSWLINSCVGPRFINWRDSNDHSPLNWPPTNRFCSYSAEFCKWASHSGRKHWGCTATMYSESFPLKHLIVE